MSITFWNPANPAQYEDRYDSLYEDTYPVWVGGGLELNLSNSNALELLEFLTISNPDYSGAIPAKELEALCRRALIRLNNVSNLDEEIPTTIEGNIIYTGRPAGYLKNRVEEFLELACQRTSDDDQIYWG